VNAGESEASSVRRKDSGFSVTELLIAITIAGILMGAAWTIIINTIPMVRADSALETVVSQLRQARFGAVDQRRNFLVTFNGTAEIVVVRQEINITTGAVSGTTPVADVFLPPGVTYTVMAGVPDTPDGFGNSGPVAGFNCSGNTTPCQLTFQSDGEVLSGTVPVNGTVFFGIAGSKNTQRAVTIMGATGRTKGYRFNGTAWY
jgi:prepilin-type N-terminal cleavage/methylation domain-containing protein